MATTPGYGWPFETRDDPPAGYARRRDLALAIESTVASVEAATAPDAILAALDGRIPGQRIATSIVDADSGEFGSQTQVLSVTAPLVAGRVYRVTADLSVDSDTNGDRIVVRMKRDDDMGGNMQIKNVHIEVSSGFGWPAHLEAEYTPNVDEMKTFVVTIDGVSGSGLVHLEASDAGWPAFMYVDYIRDA